MAAASTRISVVSLVVRDQQEAPGGYREKIGFKVRKDAPFAEGKARLAIAPPAQKELMVVLEPLDWGLAGDDPEKKREIIGRNGFVIETDDCRATVKEPANAAWKSSTNPWRSPGEERPHRRPLRQYAQRAGTETVRGVSPVRGR